MIKDIDHWNETLLSATTSDTFVKSITDIYRFYSLGSPKTNQLAT